MMPVTPTYWLTQLIIMGTGYLYYRMLLHSRRDFQFNRFFLLILPLLAFCFPFLPSLANANQQIVVLSDLTASVPALASDHAATNFPYLLFLYLAGVTISAGISVSRLVSLRRRITTSKSDQKKGSWTFFNKVYIEDNLDVTSKSAVIQHETTHSKQLHSLDLLIYEIYGIICWPNIFVHLAKSNIREVHEFIADANVTQNKKAYARLILSRVLKTKPEYLSHSFFSNNHSLKRRIMMLNKSRNSGRGRYYLVFPFLLGVLFFVNTGSSLPGGEVDKMPEFPGGKKKLSAYIQQELKYPKKAMKEGVEGKVLVSFTVSKSGKVTNTKVVESVHPLLDQEAARVVSGMPDWKPGSSNGKPVAVTLKIPIKFEYK